METVIGKEVAEKMFSDACDSLGIDMMVLMEDDKSSVKKILSAMMQGRLTYENEVFELKLLKPVGEVESVCICEPTGVQLRAMREIKDENDNVGKSMAVLGEVTGLGLPVINNFGSRDMMVAVGIISLFL